MECRISLDPKKYAHCLRFTCVEDKNKKHTISVERFGCFNVNNVAPTLYNLFGRVAQKMNNVCHLATQNTNGKGSNQKSKEETPQKNDRFHALASLVLGASAMVGVWYCRNNSAQCDYEEPQTSFQHNLNLSRISCIKKKRRKKQLGIANAVSHLGISSIEPSADEEPDIEPPPTLIIIKRDPNAIRKPSLPAFMHLVSRAANKKLP